MNGFGQILNALIPTDFHLLTRRTLTNLNSSHSVSAYADVLESNPEGQPLIYTQGSGEILNALETELLGLVAGDEKLVTLAPEDAYGTIDPAAFQEVPIDQIPEEARKVDTLLNAPGYQGTIRVAEVQEEIVILDFNHPLAGKSLTFDITIVSVE